MTAKKKDKKNVKKVTPKPADKTTLSELIKQADQAVVVISTKGNVEVTGIKNINYSYEAKGLLIGAMDTYNSRPVIAGLNNNTRIVLSHLINIGNKITELVNLKDAKKKVKK